MTQYKQAVLVTGGASGIGFETARLLIEEGALVHLVDRSQEALDKACDELAISRKFGHAIDITDDKGIDALFDAIFTDGGLTGIVNCAGIGLDKPMVDTGVEEFRRILDVNVTGSFIVARAATRHWLKDKRAGAIVNISSVSGLTGNKGRSAYGSSKGAINTMTYILATELGRNNIRVNAVAPGAVDTPLARAVHTEDVRRQWHERIPQGRYGDSREIAQAVSFLLSDKASYVNGQVLAVDGGFVNAGLAPE
ncbi:SDR family NAD(P)-dependent oxidoreductase [Limoniibacter endophyticus]|uniref:Oxidoreductase n=1 Tax=Limoniibacter endophyticus TaxID=1565040 RepID=A0A8J3DJ89_9HYPH|nr:SDR family oxidoreductase [Limoniibacter endophyticus]GHC72884.1 oxidoreductase [Limoniibacter endophyticus]